MNTNLKKYLSVLFITAVILATTGITMPVSATPLTVSGNDTPAVSGNDTPAVESEYYTISENTITVIAKDGTDITTALNESLLAATEYASSDQIYTVKVPAGFYKISSTLHIYSNTTLDMYDVTISAVDDTEYNMLFLGDINYVGSPQCKGYNGFENVTVLGGTFLANSMKNASPVFLCHATNVTFKDFTISGGQTDHLFETAAINNFTVDNCTFKNMSDSKYTDSTTREALQIDIVVSDNIFPHAYHDGTMMKNVTIKNCTFKNVSRGIGSHSQLLNAYHENIKIINNTFTDVEKECVVGLSYYNCEISGNKMTDCGAGIIVLFSKNKASDIFTTPQSTGIPYNGTTRHDAKTVIKNNTIKAVYNGYMGTVTGIEASGKNLTESAKSNGDGGNVPAGDYYISGVEITGNTITTAGYGIVLQDAKNCVVSGNKITGSGYNSADKIAKDKRYNGIHCGQASTKNKITNNTITSAQGNGMYFQAASTASEITGNTIKKSGKDGITFSDKSGTTGDIRSNVISGVGEHGISLSESTVKGTVSLNQITNAKLSGINIYNSSTVTGNVLNNTISGSKVNGINIGDSSKVKGNISGNKISDTEKTGIQVISKSSVLGNIENNTITDSTLNGINVMTRSRVGGNICTNTIRKSGKTGINVYSSSEVNGNIAQNTVSASAVNGICAGDSSVIGGEIENNTVSDTTKTGIQIITKSSVLGNIKNNTVSNSTVNGICVSDSSVAEGSILSNKISKSKKNGILISAKSSVYGNIKSNTISNSTVNGICVSDSSVVKGSILSNKISASKKTGIQIIQKSSVNKKISDNTVKNSTVNAISVLTSSKVKKGIENNTIIKAKKYGIYVYEKSTVKPLITGNKISSCDTPIVVASNCATAVRANTLTKNKNNYSRIAGTSIKVGVLKAPKFISASGKNKKISLKWKKVKGVSGYSVELSTTADFKKISKTIDTKSLKGEFKKLKKGKTYYVRICAYMESGKARIYGNYSKAKKIKIK